GSELEVVCRVRIHEKLRFLSDCGARVTNARQISRGITPDFHFHLGDPLLHPSNELAAQLGDRIRSEAAASVNGNLIANSAQQRYERKLEQLALEIPHCIIDCGDRGRCYSRPADVSYGVHHSIPRGRYYHRVATGYRARKMFTNNRRSSRRRVRVSDSGHAARCYFGDYDRRRAPLERPVRLRLVGGDSVGC